MTLERSTPSKLRSDPHLLFRFRLVSRGEIALGPGKVELLRRVQETGSIASAAREMKMSYMRAWSLVQTMNRCFNSPLIKTERGGDRRGGASLTATGLKVLRLTEQLERECRRSTRASAATLTRLLK